MPKLSAKLTTSMALRGEGTPAFLQAKRPLTWVVTTIKRLARNGLAQAGLVWSGHTQQPMKLLFTIAGGRQIWQRKHSNKQQQRRRQTQANRQTNGRTDGRRH